MVPAVSESRYDREPGYALRYRDRRWVNGSGAGIDRGERRALRSLLRAADFGPAPWLDAPSDAGRLSVGLPGPVVQLDRDPEMVRAAGDQHARACASVHALPFVESTFAGVLCMRLLQHIATPVERIDILRELARVSRGPVLVSFFDARSLQHLRRRLRGKRRSGRSAVARGAVHDELRAAGIEPQQTSALRRFVGEPTLVLARPAAATTTP